MTGFQGTLFAPALSVPERRQSQLTAEERVIDMLKKAAALGLSLALLAAPMFANEGDVPKGIPHLEHVFVIMMENHAYGQIVGNPSAPYANKLMQSANAATNYFAVAHPSLTNIWK